jgi:Resolvase, N terminal domain
MKRAAIYLRVSTLDQTMANQERDLRQVAGRAGWEVVKVYKDHGISGAKGPRQATPFQRLMPRRQRTPVRYRDGMVRRSTGPQLARLGHLPV